MQAQVNLPDFEDIFEALMEHVEIEDQCMIWTGPPHAYKYGTLCYNIDGNGPKNQYVHRLSYMCSRQVYPLPAGGEVSHLCHRTRCIRPDHLTLESGEQNRERAHCKNQSQCTKSHFPHCIL